MDSRSAKDETRVGLVGIGTGLSRRLTAAVHAGLNLEACEDPVRFATDSAADHRHQRVLVLSLDLDDIWDLLAKLRVWSETCPLLVIHSTADAPAQLTSPGRLTMACLDLRQGHGSAIPLARQTSAQPKLDDPSDLVRCGP